MKNVKTFESFQEVENTDIEKVEITEESAEKVEATEEVETVETTDDVVEKLNNVKTFESFQKEESTEAIDEGWASKFFTGHDDDASLITAQKKFVEALGSAEKALKAAPKEYAQAEIWDKEYKTFLMGVAYADKYRGGLRTQKGGGKDKRLFIVYDPKATGFQELAAAAGGISNLSGTKK